MLSAKNIQDLDNEEINEWIEAIRSVVQTSGIEHAKYLINKTASEINISASHLGHSSYLNTIPLEEEPEYPGDLEIEEKITNIVRWNALCMVMRANEMSKGIGGHISTFASSAVLYEVGYNHFYKGPKGDFVGDQVFFQGHASPGMYARGFVEGVISKAQMDNFRRELAPGGGLPSYPHPKLLPQFWQFPTVSMGIGPLTAIYLARFNRYLQHRSLKDTSQSKVWAYLGDGELDEPESLGALTLASREKLDNLVFVINCNLQRLDGPVRGNGSIIREMESLFNGAGWNVIKVLWGSDWDPLFDEDKTGGFNQLFQNTVDGEFQRISISSSEKRREYFNQIPEIGKIMSTLSDKEIVNLKRGGLDYKKVYAAYHRATTMNNGKPTVIIAKTVKGYGMGESGEGRNIAHQQKSLSNESLKNFAQRFNIPLTSREVEKLTYYELPQKSLEREYIKSIRLKLGPMLPKREVSSYKIPSLEENTFEKSTKGSGTRLISTTKAFVQVLTTLLRHKEVGKHIVPIIPDEARTFGMEGLFRQYNIYSSYGQLYEPVDQGSLMPYREAINGQVLQEGINEAGSLCSFISSGISYSYQKYPMIPFYSFYSMFGFQRVGDFIWAASDMKTKGFLMGGTAGRTTLNGEGLQHEDGHSFILASTYPTIETYDPAYEYEMAVIIQDGIKRMYLNDEDIFYYISMYNEDYLHPSIDSVTSKVSNRKRENVVNGILQGGYLFRETTLPIKNKKKVINLLSSGVILKDVEFSAIEIEKKYKIPVNIYSIPSFKKLRENALKIERYNRLHPENKPQKNNIEALFSKATGSFLAVTDYMRALPEMISPWIKSKYTVLGTDGLGRSSSREELRNYFEIDTNFIIYTSLYTLFLEKEFKLADLKQAMKDYKIDPNKVNSLELFNG